MANPSYKIFMPTFNKGTGFTHEERDQLKLRGLLPARVETIEEQEARVLTQFRAFQQPIDKYIYLSSLQDRNVTLFFRVLIDNLEEAMPIVYTPTVGEACVTFSHNFRTAKGMYFTPEDKGKFREMLDNWPEEDVNIIVVTDGSRILGLGDLGANGMGIPIGKLSLYVAGSGFNPRGTLPVTFDFGTNNEKFLADPQYIGYRQHRLDGAAYYELVDEFMAAVKDKWPTALVQFEDFSNDKCFYMLEKYRNQYLCFNDDIQGTGAVVLSGFINSLRVANCSLADTKLVFFGAGSAGVGVADMIVKLFEEAGFSTEDARKHFYFVDSRGLVATNRPGQLESHKLNFARSDVENAADLKSLYDVVKFVRPTVLIGLSGIGQSFTKQVIEEMYQHCKKPIIMSLSNPTSKAECTAQEAYEWTEGNAIFASGSPFPPCEINGKTLIPGQGNNMFIFPGLGFGAFLSRSSKVTDLMIVSASKTLAQFVSDERIKDGNIYPAISDIREISANIAANVIKVAKAEGVSKCDIPDDQLLTWVKQQMYNPSYE